MRRTAAAVAAGLSLIAAPARAQSSSATSGEKPWSFDASAYTYVVPDTGNYVQPAFSADREWLHLGARYNYEAQKTASLWMGYNISGGDTVAWDLTPMLGGVFGDLDGVAPGYLGSLSWRKLEFYSEGEYVITGDASERFFYNWSELALAPVEWFRFGLVTQRTRAYQSDRDIQRGLLVGFSYKLADVTTYVFNPDDERPTIVVAVGVSF